MPHVDCRIPQVSGASCFRLTSQLRTHFGISIHFATSTTNISRGWEDWIERGQDNVDTNISRRRHERTAGGSYKSGRRALIEIGIDEGACSAASAHDTRGRTFATGRHL